MMHHFAARSHSKPMLEEEEEDADDGDDDDRQDEEGVDEMMNVMMHWTIR